MNNYRILRIAPMSHYPLAIERVYENNPGLESKPYEEQMRALFAQGLFYSDGFSKAMRGLGNEAFEIVYDAQKAQETWALENGLSYNAKSWRYEILLGQIEAIKPDVVYYQGACPFPEDVQKTFSNRFPFVQLVAIHAGFPLPLRAYKYFDIIFVAIPLMKKQLQADDIQSHLIYHSFNDSILTRLGSSGGKRDIGFSFIGSSGISFPATPHSHLSRYMMLMDLITRTELRVWEMGQTGPKQSFTGAFRQIMKSMAQHGLNKSGSDLLSKLVSCEQSMTSNMGIEFANMARMTLTAKQNGLHNGKPAVLPTRSLKDLYPDRCQEAVFGMDMYRILARSNVTFNIHTNAASGNVGNIRMFEATGVGACLLTDSGSNMADLFEVDREVVTFSSLDECVEKAAYLLEHDDIRAQIAIAGQKRVLRDHTISNRCERIDHLIRERLRGPMRVVVAVPAVEVQKRLTPLNIACIALSESEVDIFTGVSLPSQLSAGNLPRLKGNSGVHYSICAPSSLVAKIKESGSFKELEKILPVSISTGGRENVPVEDIQRATASFKRAEILKAADARAALIMLTPDIILSDGTFPKLYAMATEGKKYLVLVPDLPVDGRYAKELFNSDGFLETSSRRLAEYALRHPSPAIRWSRDGKTGATALRSKLFWRVGDNGMLIRCFDWFPLLTWPRAVSFLNWAALDPDDVDIDMYYNTAPNAGDIHVATDSDDIAMLRLTDGSKPLPEFDKSNPTRFRLNHLGADHRRYSQFKYYLRANNGEGEWKDAENMSDKFIARLHTRLEARATVNDLLALAKLLTAGSGKPHNRSGEA